MKKRESDREAEIGLQSLIPTELFRRAVPLVGYQVAQMTYRQSWKKDAELHTGRVVTLAVPWGADYPTDYKTYAPLDASEGALFRSFAKIDADKHQDIVGFANEYGLLGIRQVWATLTATNEKRLNPAETVGDWADEVRDMRRAVDLWQLAEDGNQKRLWDLVKFSRGAFVYRDRDVFGDSLPEDLPIPSTDFDGAARYFAQKWVNEKLAEHAAPRLLLTPATRKYSFRIFPNNLLGALWIQFARQIAGEVKNRQCKVCSTWFTISTEQGGAQPHREFCSAACRQRDHRRKVAEAREMKAAGKTLRQIATNFETKTETITNWLNKEK
jgi:hypothetical protein